MPANCSVARLRAGGATAGRKGIRMESRHIKPRAARIHTVAGAAGDEGRAHG
jgi:hypothetical protein